ncbi:MAG TPA: hypothetical protein VFB78_17215 [Acidimicrobiales bacterium]|nr:hypothetical protein [Acidimicrobiales bacterium]
MRLSVAVVDDDLWKRAAMETNLRAATAWSWLTSSTKTRPPLS